MIVKSTIYFCNLPYMASAFAASRKEMIFSAKWKIEKKKERKKKKEKRKTVCLAEKMFWPIRQKCHETFWLGSQVINIDLLRESRLKRGCTPSKLIVTTFCVHVCKCLFPGARFRDYLQAVHVVGLMRFINTKSESKTNRSVFKNYQYCDCSNKDKDVQWMKCWFSS